MSFSWHALMICLVEGTNGWRNSIHLGPNCMFALRKRTGSKCTATFMIFHHWIALWRTSAVQLKFPIGSVVIFGHETARGESELFLFVPKCSASFHRALLDETTAIIISTCTESDPYAHHDPSSKLESRPECLLRAECSLIHLPLLLLYFPRGFELPSHIDGPFRW